MQISSTDTLGGVVSTQVRDALKRLRDRIWTLGLLANYLKVGTKDAQAVLEALQGLGYISQHAHSADRDEWTLTETAGRFINATAAKPIARKTAEKLVREFLTRVDEVNWNPHYLYQVRRVVAFGSYLTDTDRLGDGAEVRWGIEVGLLQEQVSGDFHRKKGEPQLCPCELPYHALHELPRNREGGRASASGGSTDGVRTWGSESPISSRCTGLGEDSQV